MPRTAELFNLLVATASTDGVPINVTSTTPPGDTLHTVGVVVGEKESIDVYAWTEHTAVVDVTLDVGGAPLTRTLTPKDPPELLLAGVVLQNGIVLAASVDVGEATLLVLPTIIGAKP